MRGEELKTVSLPGELVARRLGAIIECHMGPFLDEHQDFEVTMSALHWIGQHPDTDPTQLALEDFRAAFGFAPRQIPLAETSQQAA